MANRTAVAYVTDGHVLRKVQAEWDGTALIEKKSRRKYIVLSEPMLTTEKAGLGTKAVNAFFVSRNTSTSFDLNVLTKWRQDMAQLTPPSKQKAKKGMIEVPVGGNDDARPEGHTVDAPSWSSTVIDEDPVTGDLRPYRVTPEYIFEQSDSADMRAWNQAQGTNNTMLWLAGGAGAAGMVLLYFIFQLVKGTSFFGGGG